MSHPLDCSILDLLIVLGKNRKNISQMVIDYGMKVLKKTPKNNSKLRHQIPKLMGKIPSSIGKRKLAPNFCFHFNGARARSKTVSLFGCVLKTKPILYDFLQPELNLDPIETSDPLTPQKGPQDS